MAPASAQVHRRRRVRRASGLHDELRCREHGRDCIVPPDVVKEESPEADGGVRLRLYRVGQLLGKGGFARVYRFTEISSGIDYAVKVVSKCRVGEKREGKERLRQEVRIQSSLNSERVVRLIRYFQDRIRVYLVMDLCGGPSMAEMVRMRGSLSEEEVRFYARQLLESVCYLHDQRIIHRDFKLHNLLLSDDMQLKLCDFGLACRLDREGLNGRLSELVGTANTVAPEVIAAGLPRSTTTYSLEADMWSVGVVIYNMCFGYTPFDADDIRDTFDLIQAGSYTFPTFTNVSQNAKHLIRSLLCIDPSKRLTAHQALKHPFLSGSRSPVPITRSPFENRTNRPLSSSARGNRISYSRHQYRRSQGGELRRPQKSWGQSNDSYAGFAHSRHGMRYSGRAVHGSFGSQQSKQEAICTEEKNEHQGARTMGDRAILSSDRMSKSLSASKARRLSLEASSKVIGPPPVDLRPIYAELWEAFASSLRQAQKWMTQDAVDSRHNGLRRFQLVAHPAGKDMPPYITKWLDYTSKYAFVTMLSDNRICANFNDGSIMFYWSDAFSVPDVAYLGGRSNHRSISDTTDMKFKADVARKAKLLARFRFLFADENDGEIEKPSRCNVSFLSESVMVDDEGAAAAATKKLFKIHGGNSTGLIYVRDWHRSRSQKAVAFRLSNSTVHVKFNAPTKESSEDVVVDLLRKKFYYLMVDGTRWTCRIDRLAEFATHSKRVYERLSYTNKILARFVS